MRLRALSLFLAIMAVVALAAGCGSSGDSSGSAQPSSTSEKEGGSGESKPADSKSGGGFSEKELAQYGKEADHSELAAASEVLSENLEAREAKDWATQCATLTKGVKKVVEQEAGFLTVPSCASVLGEQAESAPAILFKDTLSGQIDALRLEGGSASAIFHGNDGKDYLMPMKKENGEWLVDQLTLIVI